MSTFKVITINRHRMTTDGEGVTSLVALFGCPLRCKYCINNDVLSAGKYKKYTTEELIDEIMIDYCYFQATGGGVTFGGGESLLWMGAIMDFINKVPELVAVNVETSLNLSFAGREDRYKELLRRATSLIIDIKSINPKIYEAYTGRNNVHVLANLKVIEELELQSKCKVRIPYIAGYTSREDIAESEGVIRNMGFKNIEIFDYKIG